VSIGLLELAADTLGELLEAVVFVGGGAVTRLRQRHGAEDRSSKRAAERELSDLRRAGLRVRPIVPS